MFVFDRKSTEYAKRMGYDAGFNKPDTTNCHFSLFATKELTKAWEEGNREGRAARGQFDGTTQETVTGSAVESPQDR